jgi:dihydroorotate dehydrogenase electron transfer subunit
MKEALPAMILQEFCPVVSVDEVAENVFLLRLRAVQIAPRVIAGQFLNIRIECGSDPLLRRPFSVYRTEADLLECVFNVVGKGTAKLKEKQPGEVLDVLGPLGVPFSLDSPRFSTAILVGGGLGVAPLPISTAGLTGHSKRVVTFLGARSARHLVTDHLQDLRIATDDGSAGFHGTVVALLAHTLANELFERPMIFGCGPTPMLRALADLAKSKNIPCEVSLEGPMGCGIGICQGCPVELAGEEKKFALMCKDGPTFDVTKIKI